jgi:hypothetical protein
MNSENLREKFRPFLKNIIKKLLLLFFLVLIFWRTSIEWPQKPTCERFIKGGFENCMTEFDGDPKKVSELGLITVTPTIELLLESGEKLSHFPLVAKDKDALRQYCENRAIYIIKKWPSECK